MSNSLVTPWTVACQAPLSTEFSRQEYWSGLPFPSPGDLPDPGIKPGSPALQADSYHLSHKRIPTSLWYEVIFHILWRRNSKLPRLWDLCQEGSLMLFAASQQTETSRGAKTELRERKSGAVVLLHCFS